LVFSNGYLSVDSGYTGIKRIVNEFNEVDTAYAKYCHLIKNNSVYQVNYGGEKLFNAEELFLINPDQSNVMSKFSFRVIFIDYIVDWIKVPRMYTKVPKFFYGQSSIDTLITPFFYTSETGIAVNHVLEIDDHNFIVTSVEQLSQYYKVYVRPYSEESISITKEKYIIRDYNLPLTDQTFVGMVKTLFHDQYISLASIPAVDLSSDIEDLTVRNFRNTYNWFDLDISNLPFTMEIDTTIDLTGKMYVDDFTLTQNINTGDSVIYGYTSMVTDIVSGDYLLIKNDVYYEIVKVVTVNIAQNSYTVERPYQKREFLTSDDSVKLY
jgi:hypothetical protein